MTSILWRLATAVAGLVLAAGAWSEARSARAAADAYERLATFRFNPDRVADPPLIDRVTARVGSASDESRRQRVLGQYWLGRYDLLTTARTDGPGAGQAGDTADAAVLFVAANAAFRAMG